MTYDYKAFHTLMRSCKQAVKTHRKTLLVTSKAESDFVTNVDLMLETMIIKFIKKRFPEDAIISEEQVGDTLTDHPTWVIDPLDGTNNFVYGSNVYGIQFCRLVQRECVFSVLYMPETDDFYVAERGAGAYRNDGRLKANPALPVSHSIFSFGGFSKSSPESRGFEIRILDYFKDQCMGIRIFGSSCMDFSALASGQTHMHLMFSKRIWEIEAGLLLLKEAGVYVERIEIPQTDVVAICGAHHIEVLKTIKALLLKS